MTPVTSRSHAVLIAGGSNLGDRMHYLRTAIHRLSAFVDVARVSSVYESDSVGWSGLSAPKYLNVVLAGLTRCEPRQLLDAMLSIEADLGRRRWRKNEPRVIDLDLVLYEGRLLHDRALTLPHPRFAERNFVLVPLAELELSWRDPRTNRAIPRVAVNGEEVRKVGELFRASR